MPIKVKDNSVASINAKLKYLEALILSPVGDGGTDASLLVTGSLPDARLSVNIPRLNAATNAFTGKLQATLITEQLRLAYDVSNYMTLTVGATGSTTVALTGTAPQYIFSSPLIAGTFASNTTGANSNIYVSTGTGGTTTSQAQLLFASATNVGFRILERGSANIVLAANHSYGSHIIGEQTITEFAGASAHAMVSQLVVKPLVMTNDATATTADAATVYIEGPMTGVTPTGLNTSLWTKGLVVHEGATEQLRLRFDASNYLSIAVASNGAPTYAITGSGIHTFSNFVALNGGLRTAATDSGNLQVASGATAGTSTNAAVLFSGAATIGYRVIERGSTNYVMPVNISYASHIIGEQTITEFAGASTHAMVAQLVIKPLLITNDATATTTNAATLMITGPMTGVTVATRNDAFRVDTGTSFFGGDITGTTPTAAERINTTALASTAYAYDAGFLNQVSNGTVGLFQSIGNTAGFNVFGCMNGGGGSGTATASNVATTNKFTQERRTTFLGAIAANTQVGYRAPATQFYLGDATGKGGFYFETEYGISGTNIPELRGFVGFFNGGGAIAGTTEPTTLTNVFGFGFNTGVTNWYWMNNDASGSVTTPLSLGANFPTNTNNTDWYRARIWSNPNEGVVHYELINLTSGNTTGEQTNNTAELPSTTTLLAWHMTFSSAANATVAVSADIGKILIRTKY